MVHWRFSRPLSFNLCRTQPAAARLQHGWRNGGRAQAPESAAPTGLGEFGGAGGCKDFAPDGAVGYFQDLTKVLTFAAQHQKPAVNFRNGVSPDFTPDCLIDFEIDVFRPAAQSHSRLLIQPKPNSL
jgi:hypothetical protein